MFDVASYVMGKAAGTGKVVIEGNEYTFSDPDGDGHVVVEKTEDDDE